MISLVMTIGLGDEWVTGGEESVDVGDASVGRASVTPSSESPSRLVSDDGVGITAGSRSDSSGNDVVKNDEL